VIETDPQLRFTVHTYQWVILVKLETLETFQNVRAFAKTLKKQSRISRVLCFAIALPHFSIVTVTIPVSIFY
jgi:hypothetical protein